MYIINNYRIKSIYYGAFMDFADDCGIKVNIIYLGPNFLHLELKANHQSQINVLQNDFKQWLEVIEQLEKCYELDYEEII